MFIIIYQFYYCIEKKLIVVKNSVTHAHTHDQHYYLMRQCMSWHASIMYIIANDRNDCWWNKK